MRTPTVAYGRTDPDGHVQIVGRRHQINSIKKVGGFSKIDFEMDVATGGSSIKKRPALLHQIHKAHEFRVPLCVEAADRVLSTYSKKRIRQLRKELNQFGVQIAVAHNNPMFHLRIRKILNGSKSASKKRKALMRRIDGFLRWRHNTIFPAVGSPHDNYLAPFRLLRNSPVYPALERCTTHLMELDTGSPDFDWCLHGFLGSAFNDRNELLQNSRQPSADHEQNCYGMRPADADLFQKLYDLEQTPLATVDGRPKRLSCQAIANELNRLGFRNLRGGWFSRKTVFQIRRGAAYLGSKITQAAGASVQPQEAKS